MPVFDRMNGPYTALCRQVMPFVKPEASALCKAARLLLICRWLCQLHSWRMLMTALQFHNHEKGRAQVTASTAFLHAAHSKPNFANLTSIM